MQVRRYTFEDTAAACALWNEIVCEGIAFPQEERLTLSEGEKFFSSQSYTGIVTERNKLVGMYILHPNNLGRCAHLCNASYAVSTNCRNHGIGEVLVRDCMEQAKRLGFRILQFNAVVATNKAALHLYEKLGFKQLGIIPGGFRMPDGSYEDIIPHYIEL